jgi:hypothetical protein
MEYFFEMAIISHEGVDVSSNDEVIIFVFFLQVQERLLHDFDLFLVLFFFRAEMSVDDDTVASYQNGRVFRPS